MLRSFLARLFGRRFVPPAASSSAFAPPSRSRNPSPNDLLAELRGTAYACASINAAVCAAHPPRLYVSTAPGQPPPRCETRSLSDAERRSLSRKSAHVAEVTAHPLLDLLAQVNPSMNGFDLWELTTLHQEIHGVAYWLLEADALGVPRAVWPLPPHLVAPVREPNSPNLVDAYVYRAATGDERLSPDRLVVFRYPHPRDPYSLGLSPLRACFEEACLSRSQAAFRLSKFDNHALPDAIVSPDDMIGEDERDRLEHVWNAKLRGQGGGRVIVSNAALRVQLLAHSMGDLAALADVEATRLDICNAFHVPPAFLTTHTNLANLQAAREQHAALAIRPRLCRRDSKLNERLVPLFDPTGRLFLASDDPTPNNRELLLREREMYLRRGVISPDELRTELGYPPRETPP